jgi:hypothetical protein
MFRALPSLDNIGKEYMKYQKNIFRSKSAHIMTTSKEANCIGLDLLTLYHILKKRNLNAKEIVMNKLSSYSLLIENPKLYYWFPIYIYTNAYFFGIKCKKNSLDFGEAMKLSLKIGKKILKLD